MRTFSDSAGRTWQLAITVDAVRRVRDLVGVNLARLIEPREAGGPSSASGPSRATPRGGSLPLLTDLEDDLLLLVDVIYALVKPQADAQGVSDADFGRALGGEAIAGAHEAFWRELADFFRSLKRQAPARAIEKQLALVEAAMAAAERKIEALDVERIVEQTDGGSSSSAPASRASTPGR